MAGDNSTAGGFVRRNSPGSDVTTPCPGCFTGDGFNNSAAISNSQAFGNVTGGALSVAGGFAATGGQDDRLPGGSFTNVTASGAVNAGHDSIVGGLVGVLFEGGTIANSTAQNTLVASSGPNSIVGGIAGVNEGTISGTTSTAPVSGTSDSYIGGMTGINLGLVTGSATDPDIGGSGGNNFIGGIAGLNVGSIDNSTARSRWRAARRITPAASPASTAAYRRTHGDDPEFELPDRHDHQFERDRQRLQRPGRHVVAGLDSRPAVVARRLHRRGLHRPHRRLAAAQARRLAIPIPFRANADFTDQQVVQFTQPVNYHHDQHRAAAGRPGDAGAVNGGPGGNAGNGAGGNDRQHRQHRQPRQRPAGRQRRAARHAPDRHAGHAAAARHGPAAARRDAISCRTRWCCSSAASMTPQQIAAIAQRFGLTIVAQQTDRHARAAPSTRSSINNGQIGGRGDPRRSRAPASTPRRSRTTPMA